MECGRRGHCFLVTCPGTFLETSWELRGYDAPASGDRKKEKAWLSGLRAASSDVMG